MHCATPEYNAGSARIGGSAFPPTVAPQGDGPTTLSWGPLSDRALTPLGANTQFSLTFTTTVDSHYLHNSSSAAPVLAGDSFTNAANLTYDANSIAGHPIPHNVTRNGGGAVDAPTSSSQSVPIPTGFSKRIIAITRGDGTPPPPTDASAS